MCHGICSISLGIAVGRRCYPPWWWRGAFGALVSCMGSWRVRTCGSFGGMMWLANHFWYVLVPMGWISKLVGEVVTLCA